jgi:phosphatidylserine/phosphatidylglycerophosphate/cardiolipin synthase-like enzyme
MTHLAGLVTLLRQKHRNEEGKLWSAPRKQGWDRVKLLQTPNIWGQPMTRDGVMNATRQSVQALADAMENVIASGRNIVDIASLDPPRGANHQGVFWDAIEGGIRELGRRRGAAATVRFLFGYPPLEGEGKGCRRAHHARFKQALHNLWNELDEGARPNLIYGVYAKGLWYWNHAKIVASDAGCAVVGGHNLYDSDYNQYPPVHDVSVEVWGKGAIDAQNFAAYLWEYGGIANYTENIGSVNPISSTSWNPFRNDSMWNPISTKSLLLGGVKNVFNTGANRATVIEAWQLTNGGWEHITEGDFTGMCPGGGYAVWPVENYNGPGGGPYRNARILMVGRMGGWAHAAPGDQNASDYMKEYLFQNAAQAIRICHQDLIAIPLLPGFTKIKHSTCNDLANALRSNPALQVQVVVSAPWGCGRMDQYTNVADGNGPQTAVNYIMYYASESRKSWATQRAQLVPLFKRLLVAPFYFTDQVPQGHYFWPDSDEVEGCEGGMAVEGYPKSVGNHSKVMIVDNTMVVGSDNHYPSPLAEVNLVMEGDIVNQFRSLYWDPLWQYSQPHAVRQWVNDTMLSGE